MSDAEIGDGDVEIELEGQTVILRCSLGACMAVQKLHNSLTATMQKLAALDFDASCKVISAGMNLNPTQAKQLPEAVFKTGLIYLSGKLIDFVHNIANGGKKFVPPEGAADQPDPLAKGR